jgi:hypothetical protein
MFLDVRFIHALPVHGGVGLKPNLQCPLEVGLQPDKALAEDLRNGHLAVMRYCLHHGV